MSAYLIVDIEDLLLGLQRRAFAIGLYDLASRLRNAAALAAGLISAESLQAIAAANWEKVQALNSSAQQILQGAGFQTFDVAERTQLAEALMARYFSADPQPLDELILVATSPEVLSLIERVPLRKTRACASGRIARPPTPIRSSISRWRLSWASKARQWRCTSTLRTSPSA